MCAPDRNSFIRRLFILSSPLFFTACILPPKSRFNVDFFCSANLFGYVTLRSRVITRYDRTTPSLCCSSTQSHVSFALSDLSVNRLVRPDIRVILLKPCWFGSRPLDVVVVGSRCWCVCCLIDCRHYRDGNNDILWRRLASWGDHRTWVARMRTVSIRASFMRSKQVEYHEISRVCRLQRHEINTRRCTTHKPTNSSKAFHRNWICTIDIDVTYISMICTQLPGRQV